MCVRAHARNDTAASSNRVICCFSNIPLHGKCNPSLKWKMCPISAWKREKPGADPIVFLVSSTNLAPVLVRRVFFFFFLFLSFLLADFLALYIRYEGVVSTK